MAGVIVDKGLNVLCQETNPADFNTCTATGVYACGGINAFNGPISNPYGTLVVFKSDIEGGYTVQVFFSRLSSNSVYSRILSGNWVKIV